MVKLNLPSPKTQLIAFLKANWNNFYLNCMEFIV